MSIYKTFSTDEELEGRGVVLDFGDGQWVRITRAGGSNKKFIKLLEAMMKPHRRAVQLELLSDDKATEIMHTVFAKAIILEWKISDEEGKDIPFTLENALRVFKDLPEFFMQIKTEAENRSNFKRQSQEAEAKN